MSHTHQPSQDIQTKVAAIRELVPSARIGDYGLHQVPNEFTLQTEEEFGPSEFGFRKTLFRLSNETTAPISVIIAEDGLVEVRQGDEFGRFQPDAPLAFHCQPREGEAFADKLTLFQWYDDGSGEAEIEIKVDPISAPGVDLRFERAADALLPLVGKFPGGSVDVDGGAFRNKSFVLRIGGTPIIGRIENWALYDSFPKLRENLGGFDAEVQDRAKREVRYTGSKLTPMHQDIFLRMMSRNRGE